MLRLPPFKLMHPRSAREAATILAGEGSAARVVAGGTDLYPNMKRRHQQAKTVVSLAGIGELVGVSGGAGASSNGAGREIRIGAMTRLSAIAADPLITREWPALARAVASISSPLLRNMGTIGGNVCLDTRCTYLNQTEEWRRSINYCMKAEGEVCWVAPGSPRCWAVSSSDAAPVLCAIDARVKLVSQDANGSSGERTIAARDLYKDDGIDYLTKRPDEIITEILLPARDGCRASFWKLRRRGSIDFAVLTVAAALWFDGPPGSASIVTRAEIYLGAVNSYPSRADAVAKQLVGKKLTAENIAAASELARKSATPMDNTDFVARWRGQMAAKYTEAALREIAGLPVERLAPKH